MSKIEWTDKTWNPVTGCNKVSQGCKNCYAEIMHRRQMGMNPHKYSKPFNAGVEIHRDELSKPLTWKKPCMVFVNSMSDLFHEDVPFEFIEFVFEIIAHCPQHTFQILTKRPERAAEYFSTTVGHRIVGRSIPANVWLGTSVEDQAAADKRIPYLLKTPAAVRFLSCEPLLGPIDLRSVDPQDHGHSIDALTGELNGFGSHVDTKIYERVGWVIAGGESGNKARPMHPNWVRSLRDQCAAAGVPFFFKQWGAYQPIAFDFMHCEPIKKNNTHQGQWTWWMDNSTGEKFQILDSDGDYLAYTSKEPLPNHYAAIQKVGKSKSGNLLDGVQHLNFPTL